MTPRSYDVDGVRVRREEPRVRVEDAPAKPSQGVLDALADAETLLSYGFWNWANVGPLYEAVLLANQVDLRGGWGWLIGHPITDLDLLKLIVQTHARAAFRAVPALRGDVR